MRIVLALAATLALGLAMLAPATAQTSGWQITSFASEITVEAGGDVRFVETIEVDFGTLERHGIFRDLVTRQRCGEVASGPAPLDPCPSGSDRLYPMTVESVTDGSGSAIRYQIEGEGGTTRIRIGDPDRTVTGPQTYRLTYTLAGTLNAFAGHDELFWNVTGSRWEVPLERVEVRVTLPPRAEAFATCFEGYASETCSYAVSGSSATFAANRTLFPGEELTIAVGWQKGVVDIQPPVLDDRVSVDDFFTFDWIEWAGFAAFGVLGLATLGRVWWLWGRDRRYRTLYYLTEDPSEHTAPLFARVPIVVEYLPPEDLRPAQMGVVVDERADTLDVTATIIDLAVRGYLEITELETRGWFRKGDWELTKLRPANDDLLPYERRLFNSLFRNREKVKVSKLKTTFHERLEEVKGDLYTDAIERRWFARNPETSRRIWTGIGFAWLLLGTTLAVGAGFLLERALMPVPLALAGVAMLPFSRAMARRTATGSESLRRVLGFKRYIATAETRRQEFAEQANLFTRYLPYAIVFECVDKWAEAFEDLDQIQDQGTALWYHGRAPFEVGAFTAGLGSFASSVSTSMASTPGGSGGSGFSGGGFSGGGGGGGGGGSW